MPAAAAKMELAPIIVAPSDCSGLICLRMICAAPSQIRKRSVRFRYRSAVTLFLSFLLRLSNFLLWQLAYAEMIFTDTFWPDFIKEELYDMFEKFANRHRRFGGVEK